MTDTTMSTPGEGIVYFQIALAAVAAGLDDMQRHALQQAVQDHAESCVVAERKRCAAIVRRFGNGDFQLGWDAEDVAVTIERANDDR